MSKQCEQEELQAPPVKYVHEPLPLQRHGYGLLTGTYPKCCIIAWLSMGGKEYPRGTDYPVELCGGGGEIS